MAETKPATEMAEPNELFERRKQDHIRLSMDPRTQANGVAGFDFVKLNHEALPDLDFSDISLKTHLLGSGCDSPIYVSSMTAGHENGELINLRLASLSHRRNILMGVGSQRRELVDSNAASEWKRIRAAAPKAKLIGNLGITQLIRTPIDQVQALVDSLEAAGLFVHLNPLQECLQPEGTPQFKGGLQAIEKLVQKLSVPVIVKEVGCGLSSSTMERLEAIGVKWMDVSGLGGTHWGRIEGLRSEENSLTYNAALAFKNWGIPTVESLLLGMKTVKVAQIWASGGVRSGLDAAKLIAMGAQAVGIAKPFLEGALQSDEALEAVLDQFEFELKIALFCTGARDIQEFQRKKVWSWT